MTEEQIKRCIELNKAKKDYTYTLDRVSNCKAKIVIGWLPNNCSHIVYNNISNVDLDNSELLCIVENFIRNKLKKVDEELKEL